MNPSKTTNNSVCRSMLTGLLTVAMVGLLSACAADPVPKPDPIGIQITAAADVNPDMQGRPSPVILHIMELTSTEQFSRLDYMGLRNRPVLAWVRICWARTRWFCNQANPGLPLGLNPLTTAVGFVAGYRDIDNAAWRQTVPVSYGITKGINVTLGQTQLAATVSNYEQIPMSWTSKIIWSEGMFLRPRAFPAKRPLFRVTD